MPEPIEHKLTDQSDNSSLAVDGSTEPVTFAFRLRKPRKVKVPADVQAGEITMEEAVKVRDEMLAKAGLQKPPRPANMLATELLLGLEMQGNPVKFDKHGFLHRGALKNGIDIKLTSGGKQETVNIKTTAELMEFGECNMGYGPPDNSMFTLTRPCKLALGRNGTDSVEVVVNDDLTWLSFGRVIVRQPAS